MFCVVGGHQPPLPCFGDDDESVSGAKRPFGVEQSWLCVFSHNDDNDDKIIYGDANYDDTDGSNDNNPSIIDNDNGYINVDDDGNNDTRQRRKKLSTEFLSLRFQSDTRCSEIDAS